MSYPQDTYYNPIDNPAYAWHMNMQARKGMVRHTNIHPVPGPMYGAVDYGPGHRCNCNKQHPKPPCPYDELPKINSVKQIDAVKVTELRDAFNNLRYKIVMSSVQINPNPQYGKIYEVEVVNCFSAPNPLVIVHRPTDEEAAIRTAEEAQQLFDSYVTAYTNLIKAETKDFQDISTYKEGIGYEMTKPECCATCKWSRLARTENDYVYGVTGKIECTNPDNLLDYDFNVEQCGLTKPPAPPYYKPETQGKLIVYPNVHTFGKCLKYEAMDKYPYCPVEGDSIADIIDRRTATIYNDLCATVTQVVVDELNNQIDDAIQNATDNTSDSSSTDNSSDGSDNNANDDNTSIIDG